MDNEYWILDARCPVPGAGCQVLDVRRRVPGLHRHHVTPNPHLLCNHIGCRAARQISCSVRRPIKCNVQPITQPVTTKGSAYGFITAAPEDFEACEPAAGRVTTAVSLRRAWVHPTVPRTIKIIMIIKAQYLYY